MQNATTCPVESCVVEPEGQDVKRPLRTGGGQGRGRTHRTDARVRFIQPEVVAGDVHRAIAGALYAQRQFDLHEGVLVRALKHALHGVHRGRHLRANVMSGLAG